MCGIVGARHDWLVSQGLEPAHAMAGAVASLAWRGPDGQAVERAGAWWLGCARLAIGPKHARQPVVRRGGRFVGVLNGAITNARELWARLLPGVEKRALLPNDAWLPLLAVERPDTGALYELRGHHAYAVVDAHTDAIVVGRDAYGEKPFVALFERIGGESTLVAFASTRAALATLGVRSACSNRRIAELFRFGWLWPNDHRISSRRVVTTLPVRSLTTTRSEPMAPTANAPRNRWRPWGEVPYDRQRERHLLPAIREGLIAAVARCSDTRVPAALSLSGGLDSSCLAFALAATERRMPAYQARAQGVAAAERDAATAVAARTRLELRPVDVGIDALDALPRLTACAGMPLGDPSVLAVHALARAAAADGIRVLLGGEGADEYFLGYRRHRVLDSMLLPPRWLRHFAPRWSMRAAARLVRAGAAPDALTALLAVTPPVFGASVLAPAFAQRLCWRDDAPLRPRPVPGIRLHRLSALQVASRWDRLAYLPADLLPKVDVATMAAGVEARCPYLDGPFAGPEFGDRAHLGKKLLRAAFASELPREVLALPKTGFALPLDRWFRGDLPWLDLLAEPRTQQRPHLRPGGVARAVDLHRSRRADIGHGLYLLVACEVFLRTLEQENPAHAPTASGRPT